jgi:hypothetical protein
MTGDGQRHYADGYCGSPEDDAAGLDFREHATPDLAGSGLGTGRSRAFGHIRPTAGK